MPADVRMSGALLRLAVLVWAPIELFRDQLIRQRCGNAPARIANGRG